MYWLKWIVDGGRYSWLYETEEDARKAIPLWKTKYKTAKNFTVEKKEE